MERVAGPLLQSSLSSGVAGRKRSQADMQANSRGVAESPGEGGGQVQSHQTTRAVMRLREWKLQIDQDWM